MTAVMESKYSTIEWKGKEVRFATNTDGNVPAEQYVYLYRDIIEASGSGILNSFIFRHEYPQFFGEKGNNLIGLCNEVVAAYDEIDDEIPNKEYRRVIDEFTNFIKKQQAEAMSQINGVKVITKEIVDAINGGPGSEAFDKLRVNLFRISRGSKSSTGLLFYGVAFKEAEREVGAEKFLEFSKSFTNNKTQSAEFSVPLK